MKFKNRGIIINREFFIAILTLYNTNNLGRITHGQQLKNMEGYSGSLKINNITPLASGGSQSSSATAYVWTYIFRGQSTNI